MDFHSMKRKELQALCKKYKIPANLSNQEMANKLTEYLKENNYPLIRPPIKEQDGNAIETENTERNVNMKVKKVRFSPEHELIEFTRSPKMMSRRKTCNSSVVNIESNEMKKEHLGAVDRIARSRGLKSVETKVNVKKRGRNAVKCDQNSNTPAIEIFDNGKVKEGSVDSLGRVMLLRGKMLEVGGKSASKRETKRVKDDDSRSEKVLDDDADEKPSEEIADNPVRVTRSRAQKLTDVHANVEKIGRKVAIRSFMNREDVGEGKLTRDSGERMKSNGIGNDWENTNIAGERHVNDPQILRRSKRNAMGSSMLNVDTKNHENDESMGLRESSKLLTLNGSGENGEIGNDVNLGGSAVPNTEEPIKVEPRRSNRRKNVIESDELKAETENRRTLRSSVPQIGTSCEVSSNEKNVAQPSVVMRRSRRKTLSLQPVPADKETGAGLVVQNLVAETENRHLLRSSVPQLEIVVGAFEEEKKVLQPSGIMRRSRHLILVSTNENNGIDSVVENLEAEKIRKEPCLVEKDCSAVQENTRRSRRIASKCKSLGGPDAMGRDSVVHQKNQAKKRKRGVILGRDVIETKNDPSSVVETMKGSGSKKVVPAAATGKVASTNKRSRLDDVKFFDASSLNGLERGDLLVSSAKPSILEGLGSTSNLGISLNQSPQNSVSDVGVTSSRNTDRKKIDISIVDSAGSSEMKLINGKELANSDTKAASTTRGLKTGITDSDGQNFVNNIRGVKNADPPLEIDVHELIVQNIENIDNNENDPEAHILSQTEDLGCNDKIVSQVLPEDLNEGFDETTSSLYSRLIGDQTYNNVAETEVDKCSQPSSCVVDHACEVQGICDQQNLDSDGTRKDNQIALEDSKFSENEGSAETAASPENLFFDDKIDIKTDVEVADVDTDKGLQPNPSLVDTVGEANATSCQENLDSDETRQDNQVLPEGSNVSGKDVLAETGSSAGSPLFGDPIDTKTDLELVEAEADKCLERSPVVEHVGEIKGSSVQKNPDADGIIQDNQVLLEGSNVSRNKGLMESDFFANSLLLGDHAEIKADVEVAEGEVDICLQRNPSGVDYAGELEGVSVQENLDYSERKQDIHVVPEGSNVYGNEGLAETNSSPERLSLDEIKTDLEVAGVEGDKCSQPSLSVVDHISEVEPISFKENLASDETRQSNDITSSFSCYRINEDHLEESANILDSNKDISPKAGVVGTFSSCVHIDYSKCTLESKASSRSMMRRPEDDNLAEVSETVHNDIASELAESNEDGCLNVHKSASYKYNELSVLDLSVGEGSAKIGPQDRVVFSGEYSVISSGEQKYKDSLAVDIITESAEFNQVGGHETDRTPTGKESYNGQNLNLEDGKSVEGGSFKSHKSKCDEDGVFGVSNLFDAEERPVIMPKHDEIITGERSIKDSEEQGIFHGSPSVGPTSMCLFARELEADLIADGTEYSIYNDKQKELNEANGSGCFKSHKSSKDGDWKFNISHLFAGEKSPGITTQDRGTISPGYSIKNFNEQVTFLDSAYISTMSPNYNEVKLCTDSSNLQETSPSKPNSDIESQANEVTSDKNKDGVIGVESLAHMTFQDAEEREEQSKNLQTETVLGENPTNVESSPSLSDIGLHNLFGTTLDSYTPSGPNDTSSPQRTEIENLTLSANKSVSKHCGSFSRKKEKERRESEKIPNENAVSPPICNEVPHTGFNADLEDKGEDATCKGLNSITEEEMEENIIALGKSCLFNEAPNNDTESTEKNSISMSGSPRNLDELEGSQGMLIDTDLLESLSCKSRVCHKTEGEMIQSNEAAFELSETDLQKSNISENSHHVIPCSDNANDSGEPSIETFRVPVDAHEAKEMVTTTQNVDTILDIAAHENPTDVESSPSWSDIGIGLHNLFGTTLDSYTPSGPNDTSSPQRTEIENLTMSTNKSVSKRCGSLTRKKEKERSGSEKITKENVVSPTICDEVSHTGFSEDLEDKGEDATCKGLTSITEEEMEENMIALGKSCLFNEAPDNDTESTEKNSISMSGSPRNLDELEGSQGMLIDTDLLESLNCKSRVRHKTEGKMIQSNEAAFELSAADLQKSNISENSQHVIPCSDNANDSGEASIETFRVPVDAHEAKEMVTTTQNVDTILDIAAHENPTDVESSPSWSDIGIGLPNLFGTTLDSYTPSGPNDTSSPQRTEIENLTMSTNKSVSKRCGSLTRKKEKERSGSEKITKESVVSPTICDEVSHTGFSEDLEDKGEDATCKGLNSITEEEMEENMIALGKSCLFNEAPDNDTESTEKNSISMSGSPRNLDELEGSQGMLIDTDLLESLNCKSRVRHKTEGKMIQSNEAAFELSAADLQKLNISENSQHVIPCSDNANDSGEASIETFRVPAVAYKAKEMVTTTQNVDTIVDIAAHENGDGEILETRTLVGDREKNGKEVQESTTARMVQSSLSQLHFVEKVEEFSNHVDAISDVPSSGKREVLKESDVDDTIKEYIDSESSLPMMFENSGDSLFVDVLSHTKDIEKPLVDSLVRETKELEEAKLGTELGVKIDSQNQIESEDGHRSSPKQLFSTAKRNARTIMIHGTPGTLPTMADMKENAPTSKSRNVGDLTTVRPAKRRALQDVHWK